ncbi:hypothetical protein JCM10212_005237 [Sporobolomyces blumeae]
MTLPFQGSLDPNLLSRGIQHREPSSSVEPQQAPLEQRRPTKRKPSPRAFSASVQSRSPFADSTTDSADHSETEPAAVKPERRDSRPLSNAPEPRHDEATLNGDARRHYPLVSPLPTFTNPPPSLAAILDDGDDDDGRDAPYTFYATRSHPFNKHGFRYTPCGPSPASPLPTPPQRLIESEPRTVRWSWEDRSPFTYVTDDARTVTTDKGWRAVRSNVGVRQGEWYWEIKVVRGGGHGGRDKGGEGQGSWVRVGVGRRESPLNAPVGIDGHSYGIRDRTGDSIHLAHPTPYGRPFGSTSTIGIYLSIPPRQSNATSSSSSSSSSSSLGSVSTRPTDRAPRTSRRDPARIMRKRVPILYKGSLYFEQLEYAPSKEMDELLVDPVLKAKQDEAERKKKHAVAAPGTKPRPVESNQGPPPRRLERLHGSKVAFWIDGECQGTAFTDLFDYLPLEKPKPIHGREPKRNVNRIVMENWHDDGMTGYFPFVSVFGGGTCSINPGPDFAYPPPDDIEATLRETDRRRRSDSGDDDRATNGSAQESTTTGRTWKPLSDRYAEFYEEQARLDDLDEIEAIRLLVEARAAARDGQTEPTVSSSTSSASAGAGGGARTGSGHGPNKKQRVSTPSSTSTSNSNVPPGGLPSAILNRFEVVGRAAVEEDSPGNSPKPVSAVGAGVKLEAP